MLLIQTKPPVGLWAMWWRRRRRTYGLGNNDITILVAVENVDLYLDSLDVREGPTGVRAAQSCTVLKAMGQWPTLHTHHFHTGTIQTLEIILIAPHFQAWKTSFQLCHSGSIWHQGADSKESPVSASVQLWRWTNCIMGRADVICL